MKYVEQNARPMGGWLLFIGFSLFLGFFQEIIPIVCASLGRDSAQENLEILGKYSNIKNLCHAFFAFIYGLLIYLFLTKKRKFVKYYITLNVFFTFFLIFLIFTIKELTDNSLQHRIAILGELNKLPAHAVDIAYVFVSMTLILWLAVICLYMFKSKRVKSTFVN
ncbi:MAG: DUF2569 family protein [Candidatus Paracaedibacter sp.]